ncbi:expressed unknown protein [Seminavis robusta]|uniref:BTB domain-containing protein n=1 Tax=Seminavis robusta TaxID=568900 RepID=A0A9N8ES72_9STRA|nr:expressed unknown protein [Seminavis robusta]|eukprot:Sro1679_g290730.1 n/a (189) ;mRNA; f:23932-24540
MDGAWTSKRGIPTPSNPIGPSIYFKASVLLWLTGSNETERHHVSCKGKCHEIVRLNVGGTKYKVSRSLIETYPDTMLAKIISKTWQHDPNSEVFIDRDGERFRYVLDYMRDQKAFVAMNVSKASIIKELEYFGFENVPDNAVDCSGANLEAAEHMIMILKDHKAAAEDPTGTIARMEETKDYSAIAHK